MEDQNGRFGEKRRRLKTPSQVQALEKIYTVYKYPSESMKAKLSDDLGLSEKQVQRWFRHRRLKDRKNNEKECPDGNRELHVGNGANVSQQYRHSQFFRAVEKQERPKSSNLFKAQPIDGAAGFKNYDTPNGNLQSPDNCFHNGIASPSLNTSSLQSTSSDGVAVPRNQKHSYIITNNSKNREGMGYSGSDCGHPNLKVPASPDQWQHTNNDWNKSCAKRKISQVSSKANQKEIFLRCHDYPSAVLAEEITDHELLKGKKHTRDNSYADINSSKPTFLNGDFSDVDVGKLPPINLCPFNKNSGRQRSERGFPVGLHPLQRQDTIEHHAISAVKDQLGRFYQKDGPPLDVQFDPLPPRAIFFG